MSLSRDLVWLEFHANCVGVMLWTGADELWHAVINMPPGIRLEETAGGPAEATRKLRAKVEERERNCGET